MPVEVVCSNCGSSFEKSPSRVGEHNYCSRDCYYEHLSERYSGEGNPSYEGKSQRLCCSYCGDSIERYESYLKKVNKTFCSDDCRGKWMSESRRGSENNNWSGGSSSTYYGKNWPEKRKKALQRDNFECCRCGMSNEEHISQFGFSLDVHHKEPVKSFDRVSEANKLSNLSTLCKRCHPKEEP